MTTATTTRTRPTRWRVVDIIVASVIGVASGLVFWIWNSAYLGPSALLQPLLPGLQGLTAGPWLFAGVLGGLIIRKPGAALYVEVVAAFFSMLFGAQWGVDTLLSGVLQGLGAEIVFAVFLYRRYGVAVATLAGAAAGLLEAPHELIAYYPGSSALFSTVFTLSLLVSGAVVAGLGSWLIARALAATGALSRFAAGRERRSEV